MSANKNQISFLLPPGRIVAGSPSFKQTEYKGQVKDKPVWFFAVAIPKTDPHIGGILNQVMSFAWQNYAHNPQVQQQMQLGLSSEKFAWKIEDGDLPGNSTKEGWAGCFVFKFSTTLGAPPCFDGNNQPLDPAFFKTGYWASVYATIAINGQNDHTAGIYMNPTGVAFAGYGAEIRTGPSADQMFGAPGRGTAHGASPNPVGAQAPGQLPPAGGQAPGFAQQGGYQQPQQQAGFQQPQYAPPAGAVPQAGYGAPSAAPGQTSVPSSGAPNYAPQPQGAAPGAPAPGAPVHTPPGGAVLGGQPHSPATAYPSNPAYPGGQQFQPNHNFGGQQ